MDLSSKQSDSASGSIRQNPLQAMLLARYGSQGRVAGTHGNPIQAQAQVMARDSMNANENDGIGDFNLGIPHAANGDGGRGGSGRSYRNPIQAQLIAREGNQGFARSAVAAAPVVLRGARNSAAVSRPTQRVSRPTQRGPATVHGRRDGATYHGTNAGAGMATEDEWGPSYNLTPFEDKETKPTFNQQHNL